MFCVIGLDGDDTLWHNEPFFSMTQERFRQLLSPYLPGPLLDSRLHEAEARNLGIFGYGVKGFVLSMIETAIEVSQGQVTAREIQSLVDFGKEMLAHPVELLEGVRPALERLARGRRLLLITKGDLLHQESKLARSGLGELFAGVEIVSEKDPATYRRILRRHGVEDDDFLMVGNSVRSDVLPVLQIGASAVHVPYPITWALEEAELPPAAWSIPRLSELPDLLQRMVRVQQDYSGAHTEPLEARAGERLHLSGRSDPERPGWLWARAPSGQSGWVPASYLEGDVLGRDYTARELSVRAGERVVPGAQEAGWCWVVRGSEQGWVPARCLALPLPTS
ncbi:MAG TPA: SH3 domain-containing protein [Candidatus Nitrosotenuis sp.]|jgi:putative hydrolase of the HAD superfamily|nr:SH3 domain-containing protein [Candidatus Nitrosotenuis sp.]